MNNCVNGGSVCAFIDDENYGSQRLVMLILVLRIPDVLVLLKWQYLLLIRMYTTALICPLIYTIDYSMECGAGW